jgi:hypothetical protein
MSDFVSDPSRNVQNYQALRKALRRAKDSPSAVQEPTPDDDSIRPMADWERCLPAEQHLAVREARATMRRETEGNPHVALSERMQRERRAAELARGVPRHLIDWRRKRT